MYYVFCVFVCLRAPRKMGKCSLGIPSLNKDCTIIIIISSSSSSSSSILLLLLLLIIILSTKTESPVVQAFNSFLSQSSPNFPQILQKFFLAKARKLVLNDIAYLKSWTIRM